MEACFMPELGTEAEGGHPSHTLGPQEAPRAQALGRSTLALALGMEHGITPA